jgi:hypothetical protein
MSSSRLLILDGVTGAGKSSILRELVGFFSTSLQVISEDQTLGNVLSDSRRWDTGLPITFPQAEAVLDALRADESLPEDAREPSRTILERFHPTYYSFFPDWALYSGMDTELHRMGARMVLLSIDPRAMPSRVLERPERAGTDWVQGMIDYYGSSDQVIAAAVASQERRHEMVARTEIPTLVIDTTGMDWSQYASQVIRFWGE